MKVQVYIGNVFFDEAFFKDEEEAETYASFYQDRGYKVRFVEYTK